MIFKQIHSFPTGPNWGKIALITVVAIIAGYIAYNTVKLGKVKIEPQPEPGDRNK